MIALLLHPARAAAVAAAVILSLAGCGPGPIAETTVPSEVDARFLHEWNDALTDVLVTDIVSPPVASRLYVYPNLAAYEVLASLDPGFRPLGGQLRSLGTPPEPPPGVDAELAATIAFSTVARGMVFGPGPLEAREDSVRAAADAALPSGTVAASIAFAEAVAETVQARIAADGYAESRAAQGYTVDATDDGRWRPTPPDYMEGLEPNWSSLTPYAIASADAHAPAPPTPFDTTDGSAFMQETMEVYHAVREATAADSAIAMFWDCNPLVSQHDGHFVSFSKKITPGGHWLGIAGIAARTAGADAMRTAEAYTLTAVSLADGFISCWDEKYRSCLTRPETVINARIDPDWRPILQTPSFPEYTSGHSVVSGAASTVLTELFGDDFAFDDDTEVDFGLPVRSFTSFEHAAEEAAVSRLLGGIHYRPAIDNGLEQGRGVGRALLSSVRTRTQALASND